jgi:hypothetical protein
VADFDDLVTEAMNAPFSGWDFSWLDRRWRSEPLPWDYSVRVAALADSARTMLDMGTRHESFLATELNRVLAPGGTFVTQQVDYHDHDDLAQMLGIEMPEEPDSWMGLAERQVTEAGLVIEEAARADERIQFNDIAAIVYYLKAVSWSIPGYSLETHRDHLPPCTTTPAPGRS